MVASERTSVDISTYSGNYPHIPELEDLVTRVVSLSEADMETGDANIIFNGRGFYSCTGIAFRSKNEDTFGFLHAVGSSIRTHTLTEEQLWKLEALEGGEAILVQGPHHVPQPALTKQLTDQFGISVMRTIPLEPFPNNPRLDFFDVIFKPRADKITVVRRLEKRVLTFGGFNR